MSIQIISYSNHEYLNSVKFKLHGIQKRLIPFYVRLSVGDNQNALKASNATAEPGIPKDV